MNAPTQRRAIPWRALLLGSIVLAALALRLLYASYGLHSERFWDERYAFENVRPLMAGSLKPVKSYYPSPVVNAPVADGVAVKRARKVPGLLSMVTVPLAVQVSSPAAMEQLMAPPTPVWLSTVTAP